MSKTLVIVESNKKAKSIGKYLGDGYEVIASNGHVADLPTNQMGVDVNDNFKPSYIIMKDKVTTLQSILDLANTCDEIIICSDPDREGEKIAWDLNRYLKNFNKPIKRALFGEITKQGIKDGLKNKKEIDLNLVSSQENRRIIDRLVGFNCSPYISSHYKKVLSSGRVQSAVTKLIVDLEKSIENFKREEFWHIHAEFNTKNKQNFTGKFEAKIKNKEEADKYTAQISDEEGFVVSSVKNQDKPKGPNPPLITVKLQQLMATEQGWDPDRTMKAAQFLYEAGFITYLRTDSVRISEDALGPARDYILSKGFPVPKSPVKYEDKGNVQAGHECLRPTNLETLPESKMITGDEKIVYKAIFEHFIASQMKPAIYSTMQIKLVGIKNKKLVFKVSGKALKDPGYLSIFGENAVGTIDLPILEKDEPVRLNTKSIKSEQKFTQPPSRYNDATILKALEDKGIGRPATYASIIKTITARNYVEKQGATFRPTAIGKEITELLEKSFSFVSYDYTSNMEIKLDQVADGKLNSLDMLKEFYSEFKKQLDNAYTKDGHDICSCGGVMVKRMSKTTSQEFFGCSNFPSCRNSKPMDSTVNK